MTNIDKLKKVYEAVAQLHEINAKLTGIDPIYDVTIKKQLMNTIDSLMEWHQWLKRNLNEA